MAFDAMPDGDPWGAWCRGCQRPIAKGEPTEEIRVESDPDRKFAEMNGPYHRACARPYLSIVNALNMLSRPFGD